MLIFCEFSVSISLHAKRNFWRINGSAVTKINRIPEDVSKSSRNLHQNWSSHVEEVASASFMYTQHTPASKTISFRLGKYFSVKTENSDARSFNDYSNFICFIFPFPFAKYCDNSFFKQVFVLRDCKASCLISLFWTNFVD